MSDGVKKQVLTQDPFIDLGDEISSDAKTQKHKQIESTNGNLFKLGENLTIQEVSELTQTIRTVFDSGMNLSIDAKDVRRIDGAGMQLLCALFRESDEQKIDIEWIENSEVINNAALQLGLVDILKI